MGVISLAPSYMVPVPFKSNGKEKEFDYNFLKNCNL